MNVMLPQSGPRAWPRRVFMTGDALGGVWAYTLDLATGLARNGTEVLLAVMGGAPQAHQREAAAAVHGLHLVWAPYRLEWMEDAAADVEAAGTWLLTLARRFKPDVVHLNGYVHAALPWERPVVVAAHSCVRTWWRAVHGEDPPESWDGYVDAVCAGLAAADAVIAPSHAFLAALEAAYGRIDGAAVVHNGRAGAGATPEAGKEALILAAGRLWDEAKNVRVLDAAAGGLSWPVAVAGAAGGPDGSAGAGVAYMRLLGALSHNDMRARCNRAAIFASPALYEPFGLAVLEAAQSGCALVLSDIPTFRELWDGTAVFFPPRDPAALREALVSLIGEEGRRLALGEAACVRSRQFSPGRMRAGTLDVYSRANEARAAAIGGGAGARASGVEGAPA